MGPAVGKGCVHMEHQNKTPIQYGRKIEQQQE